MAFVPTYNGSSLTSTIGTFGAWAHIVMVLSGGTVKFYFNGTFFNSTPVTQISSKQALTIQGSTQGTTTITFDEVGIWGRALSGTEISTLYSNTLAWPMGLTYYPDPDPGYVGGSATVGIGYVASGGAVGGSSALVGRTFTQTTTGQGAVAGGSAQLSIGYISSGGAIGGGSATIQENINPSTTGNGAVGGGADITAAIYNPTTSGGAIAGGSAIGQAIYTQIGSGGAIGGGTADNYVVINTSGGAIGGGADIEAATYNPTASGGLWTDGAAAVNSNQTEPVDGVGAIAGGSASAGYAIFWTGSGGAVCNGSASTDQFIVATGGALGGGTASIFVDYFVEGLGGGAVSGQVDYQPGNFPFRESFVVEAGRVLEDLYNFVFPVRITTNANLATLQVFQPTDSAGNKLAWYELTFDPSTGVLAFMLKANLKATTDNQFYVDLK